MAIAKEAHAISISYEPASQQCGGALALGGGHRASCVCGWWSDCYSQLSDTHRSIEVHLKWTRRTKFESLIYERFLQR